MLLRPFLELNPNNSSRLFFPYPSTKVLIVEEEEPGQ